MQPPFLPGPIVEPPYFIDREDELEKMTTLVGTLAENVLVLGQRRMGKSSLLHNVRNKVKKEHPDVGVVMLDCREAATLLELSEVLLERLLQEYRDQHAVRGWLSLKRSIAEQTIRESLGRVASVGVKSVEDLFGTYIDFREKTVDELELFRRTLRFAEAFAAERRLKFIVVFDEFQEPANFGDGVFQALKSEGQRFKRVRFVYSGSAVRVLENIFLRQDSPLYLTAGKTRLGPLAPEVVEEFVEARFKSVGMTLSGKGLRAVALFTGGIPFYVQKLGILLYLKALHAGKTSLTEADVLAAFKDMLHELSSEFEARFEYKYGINQKKILTALARKSPLRRIDIAKAIGKRTEGISSDLTQLEAWMEIAKAEHGVYKICDPVFGYWLLPDQLQKTRPGEDLAETGP